MNKKTKNKIAAFIIKKQAQINKMSGDEAEANIRALNAFKAQFSAGEFGKVLPGYDGDTHCSQ